MRGLDPEAVRASEAVRYAPLVVATFFPTGEVVQANTRARQVFGHDFSFQSIFAHREEAEHALSRLEGGGVVSEDVEVLTLSGQRFYAIEVRQIPDPVTGKQAILMSAHDMTARIEAERAKEDLISVVSHELRTPMTADSRGDRSHHGRRRGRAAGARGGAHANRLGEHLAFGAARR